MTNNNNPNYNEDILPFEREITNSEFDKFKAEGVHFLDEKYWSPRAEKVHLLGWKKALAGQFADPLTLQPTYLRRPEAEEKWGHHKTRA